MSLKKLAELKQVNGESVVVMDELREQFPEKFIASGQMDWKWFEKDIRPQNFIYIRKDKNSLSFTLQNGPIKEVGKNGCQIDSIIASAKTILESFNKENPCRENSMAITKLDEALMWLEKRTKDRENRAVEGTSKS